MVGTYTVKHQTVFGDLRVVIYDATNFTNADEITVGGMTSIYHVSTTIGTADKAVSLTTSGNVITIVEGATTYDGTMIVIGK